MRINTFATMAFERASNSLKVLYLLSACSIIPPSPLTPIHMKALWNGNMFFFFFCFTQSFILPWKHWTLECSGLQRNWKTEPWTCSLVSPALRWPCSRVKNSWPEEGGGNFWPPHAETASEGIKRVERASDFGRCGPNFVFSSFSFFISSSRGICSVERRRWSMKICTPVSQWVHLSSYKYMAGIRGVWKKNLRFPEESFEKILQLRCNLKILRLSKFKMRQLTWIRSIIHNGDPTWWLKASFLTSAQSISPSETQHFNDCLRPSDASWCGVTAAGGEISGIRPRPRTAWRPISILRTARSIDTWAEHVVKIRATAGDLDKHVTLSEGVEASQGGQAPLSNRYPGFTSSSGRSGFWNDGSSRTAAPFPADENVRRLFTCVSAELD